MSKHLAIQELSSLKNLGVYNNNEIVGILALTRDGRAAFEYSDSWLVDGFALNPLSLPLQKQVFLPKDDPFEGVFGIFNESLPDGWGWLLVDRMLRERKIDPASLCRLARLAIVGSSGMGALTYQPKYVASDSKSLRNLDLLAEECALVLEAKQVESLDELFILGGSSGGARPKVLAEVEGEPWIIKFPSSVDKSDVGLMEYEYSLAAKACGIEMSEARLFSSDKSSGFFGVKRFDRVSAGGVIRRIHMASVSGLMETSHRVPSLDYTTIAKLVLRLCSDMGEVQKLFRQMCFNVFAHNQDDHAKNLAFLFDRSEGQWSLSPAYDLTWSAGMMGEHATTVLGKGKDISKNDLLECGLVMGLTRKSCQKTANEVEEIATPLAKKWER
ncbi:MAG: type II toxin-antitoxin system HipA family toxin [Coriobacteriia bacterium]|nr:type II toxin-antitoxin system HipA family toxin [Coriobacteriia bacterium]MCL2749570.1 type II toxin-antitoxin system HipA family toxin [Coriobacteriia bacterium]